MQSTESKCDSVATGAKLQRDICDPVASESPYERRLLADELAAKGVRLTAQRRRLIEIIQAADCHLDAAELLEQANRNGSESIDRATVYRTIDLLKKHGLIDELDLMHLKGEKHYYEVKTRRDHLHMACFSCGRIDEYSSAAFERLKSEISTQTGFEIQVARLEVGGRCRHCRATT